MAAAATGFGGARSGAGGAGAGSGAGSGAGRGPAVRPQSAASSRVQRPSVRCVLIWELQDGQEAIKRHPEAIATNSVLLQVKSTLLTEVVERRLGLEAESWILHTSDKHDEKPAHRTPLPEHATLADCHKFVFVQGHGRVVDLRTCRQEDGKRFALTIGAILNPSQYSQALYSHEGVRLHDFGKGVKAPTFAAYHLLPVVRKSGQVGNAIRFPVSINVDFTSESSLAYTQRRGTSSPYSVQPRNAYQLAVKRLFNNQFAADLDEPEVLRFEASVILAKHKCDCDALFRLATTGFVLELGVKENKSVFLWADVVPSSEEAGQEVRVRGAIAAHGRSWIWNKGKQQRSNMLRDGKLALLLDMDETLLHTYQGNHPPPDALSAVYSNGRVFFTERSGATAGLQRLSKKYCLHLVTAGEESYAHAVLRKLDWHKYFESVVCVPTFMRENRGPCPNKCFEMALLPCGPPVNWSGHSAYAVAVDDKAGVWITRDSRGVTQVRPFHGTSSGTTLPNTVWRTLEIVHQVFFRHYERLPDTSRTREGLFYRVTPQQREYAKRRGIVWRTTATLSELMKIAMQGDQAITEVFGRL